MSLKITSYGTPSYAEIELIRRVSAQHECGSGITEFGRNGAEQSLVLAEQRATDTKENQKTVIDHSWAMRII